MSTNPLLVFAGRTINTRRGVWTLWVTAFDPVPTGAGYRFTCTLVHASTGRTLEDIQISVYDPGAWPEMTVLETLARRLTVGRMKSRTHLFFGDERIDAAPVARATDPAMLASPDTEQAN